VIAWLTAYVFTVAFEMPIVAYCMRRAFPDGRALVALTLAASLITHPVLWFATEQTGAMDLHLAVTELLIALVEAALFFGSWRWCGEGTPSATRCIGAAVLANAFSVGLGHLLFSC
jgi:hypothetical protein